MNPDPGPYLLLNQRVPWLPIVGPVFLFLNTYFSLFIISTPKYALVSTVGTL